MKTLKDTLMDLFELDKMEPEKALETVERLAKLIFQSTLVRVLPVLSEEDFDKYEKLLEEENAGDKVLAFLKEKIPNFDQIIKEEAELLRVALSKEFKEYGL